MIRKAAQCELDALPQFVLIVLPLLVRLPTEMGKCPSVDDVFSTSCDRRYTVWLLQLPQRLESAGLCCRVTGGKDEQDLGDGRRRPGWKWQVRHADHHRAIRPGLNRHRWIDLPKTHELSVNESRYVAHP